MTNEDSLAQMQREWRETVLDSLKDLKKTAEQLRAEMHSFRLTVALHSDVAKIDERVAVLEKDKMKFLGAVIVLNCFLGAAPWVIGWLAKAH